MGLCLTGCVGEGLESQWDRAVVLGGLMVSWEGG